MAVAGIIAEFNPFHRGHRWQLETLRGLLGEDTAVVTAMSGNFVQRGDMAVFSKTARCEMALRGGADLVLELPTPWAAATAERFAQGGVALLAAAGVVTHLAFGSECADLRKLQAAAECLDSEDCQQRLRELLKSGVTFAAARQQAVRDLAGDAAECMDAPNDNLGIEYLRALRRLPEARRIEPVALPRIGAAHDSGELGDYPSASAIRRELLVGRDWEAFVPETTAEIIRREMEAGRGPVSMERCEQAVLAVLRCRDEELIRRCDGGGEGLYRRFCEAVRRGSSVEEILEQTKTKRYTLARLRRLLLHSYLGITPAPQGATPPYLRVLGADGQGRALLRQMEESALLPVITKPGHVRRLGGETERIFDQESACTDLYVLGCPDWRSARPGQDYAASPVML